MSEPKESEKPAPLEKMPVETKSPESLSDLIKILSPHFPSVLKMIHTHSIVSTVCETIKILGILAFAGGVLFFVYKVNAGGDSNLAEKTIIGLFGFLGGFLAAKKTSN